MELGHGVKVQKTEVLALLLPPASFGVLGKIRALSVLRVLHLYKETPPGWFLRCYPLCVPEYRSQNLKNHVDVCTF